MVANNSLNITAAGLVRYDGSGSFTGVTLTQFSPLIGAASNGITSLGPLINGQLVIGSTGVSPVASTLTAGTGISVVNAAGTITLNAVGSGVTWQNISASQTLAVNNGYQCTGGAALVLLLPAVSAVGDVIEVTLDGSTSWQVTQAAGQAIRFGSSVTTGGAGGSLTSTAQGDSIRMVCSVPNLRWNVLSSEGNISLV